MQYLINTLPLKIENFFFFSQHLPDYLNIGLVNKVITLFFPVTFYILKFSYNMYLILLYVHVCVLAPPPSIGPVALSAPIANLPIPNDISNHLENFRHDPSLVVWYITAQRVIFSTYKTNTTVKWDNLGCFFKHSNFFFLLTDKCYIKL